MAKSRKKKELFDLFTVLQASEFVNKAIGYSIQTDKFTKRNLNHDGIDVLVLFPNKDVRLKKIVLRTLDVMLPGEGVVDVHAPGFKKEFHSCYSIVDLRDIQKQGARFAIPAMFTTKELKKLKIKDRKGNYR